ncbi:MAG: Ig domain-containing protein, partial [Fidelibacterota bacterium]
KSMTILRNPLEFETYTTISIGDEEISDLNGNGQKELFISKWDSESRVSKLIVLESIRPSPELKMEAKVREEALKAVELFRIISYPDTVILVDSLFEYRVRVKGEHADSARFSLETFPSKMTIDEQLGLILWKPTIAQLGVYPVSVKAATPETSVVQNFRIYVNSIPEIVSIPDSIATVNQIYSYQVEAVDQDKAQRLRYSLIKYPKGMIIDPNKGIIQWKPDVSQIAKNRVILAISDGFHVATQSFDIEVNSPPRIVSDPITFAVSGILYNYKIDAVDVNDDSLEYILKKGPKGAKIDRYTGKISWVPGSHHAGVNDFRVQVRDRYGEEDQQSFKVYVFVEKEFKSSSRLALQIVLTLIGQIFLIYMMLNI